MQVRGGNTLKIAAYGSFLPPSYTFSFYTNVYVMRIDDVGRNSSDRIQPFYNIKDSFIQTIATPSIRFMQL